MVSRYVNGPVKQEGICLLAPPPQHYRMIAHQRTDGYHVATQQGFVPPQPPSQPNNQVPPLRMPPAGPPTQSSTPPNSDLKVQSMTQQQSMNIAYVPQTTRGPPSQNFYRPQQTTQNPRMANHRPGQQPIFSPPSSSYVPVSTIPHPTVFLNPAAQYYNGPRTQQYLQGYSMIHNQHLYFQQTPQTQPQTYFFNPPVPLQRPMQSVAATPQNTTQPPPANITIPQPQYLPPQTQSSSKKTRRSFAIPVIDPSTGKDKLNEVYEELEESHSHPPSGESSARETPQPHINSNTKDIQATFAKQVAQAIVEDKISVSEEIDQPQLIENLGYPLYPQATATHPKYDAIVQTSKLQAATKEFIPAGLAKETTPVVSAITDAEEVTINTSNKQKDRDSPAKARNKIREQTTLREHKDSVKEAPPKDVLNDKSISSKDEFKQKDLTVINVAPSSNKDVQLPSSATLTSSTLRDDKKIAPRKEKTDVKYSPPNSSTAISEDVSSDRTLVIPISQQSSEIPVPNAKSKNNAQKGKEIQKQPSSQPQQQPSTVVPAPPITEKPVQQPPAAIPPSQPLKQTSKNNKSRDLNMKGARKEGTDMDAFNDNIALEDTTNANHPSSVNNEYININNTNNVMLNNNSNITTTIINDIKPPENNDIMTINTVSSEIKSLPKSKTDVIDVNKETTKLGKPTTESEDEPDCAILDNDKLVQVKNEVNSKVNNEVETIVRDSKPSLPYRDDQWSPFNPDGKKIYGKDFLIALRTDPKSKQKPDNLPDDIIANESRVHVGEISRYAPGGRPADFTPNFGNNNYSSKSLSQRGVNITKRKSQQGAVGGNNKGAKPNVNRVTISLKEDVKLRESENAWKPARFVLGANMTEDEKKTEDLYKKVRGVLNKLTPQKYNTLLEQIKNFSIDTTERLQGVIDLVFEKAVDEPNFSVAYATLCGHLALLQVPTGSGNKKDGQEFVNFRKLLITRCQLEFEKNSVDESERNVKLKEIEECTDAEKKKDLLLDLEDYDRRLRMKSVGNIRFIGELYKQNMLTANIMMRCLNNLLKTNDEESLECLCKLLTTVGKELESKGENLTTLFNPMKEISDRKHGKISSRVRFMIQDVIDLRNSKWVPRRQDLNPKTMDQIQKEAETEQLNIQAMNTVPINTGRRDDRVSLGNNMSMNNDKKRRNAGNTDEWCTMTSPRGTRTPSGFTFRSEKLKHATIKIDEPFGGSHLFDAWGRGSGMKQQNSLGNNMYAPLQTLDTDKFSNIGMRQKEYQVKSSSMERYNRQPSEGPSSRSGSQNRSRDNSATAQRNKPSGIVPSTPKPMAASTDAPASVVDSEILIRKIHNIIEEYLNDVGLIRDSDEEIKNSIPTEELPRLVYEGYMLVLERTHTARNKTGSLFAYLIKSGTLPMDDYCTGLVNVLAEAQELIIDIPKVWDYVAELLVPLLCENAVTFHDLYNCLFSIIKNDHAPKILVSLFNLIIKEKGPNFLQSSWKSSQQKFSDYMQESKVDAFLKENSFEFMIGNDNSQLNPNHNSLSYDEIHDKLLSFFHEKAPSDDVVNWINANVGESKMGNQFIRTLTTAILNYAIVNTKLKDENLAGKYVYFNKFCNNITQYELQCLYALQTFLHKLEYPQGLLLQIFNKLYEDNMISNESFLSWESCNDPAEQEGKGVALKQLTCFFTQLKEVDEDSSDEEEASGV